MPCLMRGNLLRTIIKIRFAAEKVGPDIPLSSKKYASGKNAYIEFKTEGSSEEKLSALETFFPSTHFVEWDGEPGGRAG